MVADKASEGEEMDKLKVIVAKTGSMIRVMPEVIPQDMRSVMADMEVLEAKEKVAKEKADPEGKNKNKRETIAENNVPENTGKVATDGGNKSGKIKRRGTKKSNSEDEVKVGEKGGNTSRPSSQEATDTAIVKRMVGSSFSE